MQIVRTEKDDEVIQSLKDDPDCPVLFHTDGRKYALIFECTDAVTATKCISDLVFEQSQEDVDKIGMHFLSVNVSDDTSTIEAIKKHLSAIESLLTVTKF